MVEYLSGNGAECLVEEVLSPYLVGEITLEQAARQCGQDARELILCLAAYIAAGPDGEFEQLTIMQISSSYTGEDGCKTPAVILVRRRADEGKKGGCSFCADLVLGEGEIEAGPYYANPPSAVQAMLARAHEAGAVVSSPKTGIGWSGPCSWIMRALNGMNRQ